MGEYPDFGTPDRWHASDAVDRDEDETELSAQSKQEIAHDRGRICKKRGCVVCAPLRERRRLKKKERRAEAQALLHAKGQPCGRGSCELAICVNARKNASFAQSDDSAVQSQSQSAGARAEKDAQDEQQELRDRGPRRQAERHRVGLPCGSEYCDQQLCIDGFAQERTRRHRARRPCRSATCDNAICVAGRSKN
jgi:hypothetical protein